MTLEPDPVFVRIALETGDLPVEQVARQAGFGAVETMRRAFGRRVGVSPVDYDRDSGGRPHENRHPAV